MTRSAAIKTAVTQLLSGVTVANGYQTDAGLHVFRELEYTERPDVIPCIAWYGGETGSGNNGDVPPCMGEENHLWPLSIEGFISDDLNGVEGEKLRTDLVKALRSDYTLGGLCEPIENIRSSVSVTAGGDDITSTVTVNTTVLYVTTYGEDQ